MIRPALRGRLGALHPSLTRTSPPPHAFSQNPAAGLKLIFFFKKKKKKSTLTTWLKCHRRRHIRTPSPRTAPSPRRIRLLLLCFADERNASATAARDGPLRAAQAARDLRRYCCASASSAAAESGRGGGVSASAGASGAPPRRGGERKCDAAAPRRRTRCAKVRARRDGGRTCGRDQTHPARCRGAARIALAACVTAWLLPVNLLVFSFCEVRFNPGETLTPLLKSGGPLCGVCERGSCSTCVESHAAPQDQCACGKDNICEGAAQCDGCRPYVCEYSHRFSLPPSAEVHRQEARQEVQHHIPGWLPWADAVGDPEAPPHWHHFDRFQNQVDEAMCSWRLRVHG